jgi:hypothetical protein
VAAQGEARGNGRSVLGKGEMKLAQMKLALMSAVVRRGDALTKP